MLKLDQQEIAIIKQLIRNPRVSDNQIARLTSVPVMTVNRKRKKLEGSGFLKYYASISAGDDGIGIYHARQLYILKLRRGITIKEYIEDTKKQDKDRLLQTEYVVESHLGEKDGHLAIVVIIEAKTEAELVEIFNGKLIPSFVRRFGKDAVDEVITTKINLPIRDHHNYLHLINMENGRIKKDWPDEYIFVGKADEE